MATPIDCRAYYIDSHCHVTEKSSQALCQNLNNNNNNRDAGTVFSVSKYLIDKAATGIERNSSDILFHRDNIARVADSLTDGERNGAANEVATAIDTRTSGHARVRGRLRRVMCRLETLLRDMKAVARDFRDFIVHTDHVADYVHRRTTSGPTESDSAVVLENRPYKGISGHHNYLRSTMTEKHVSDTVFLRDPNWNWKSTNAGTYNADNDSAINNVLKLLPETEETAMTLTNRLIDNSNNRSVYNDSAAYTCNFTEESPICRAHVSGNTASAGSRVRPRRMVTTSTQKTQTTKQSVLRNTTDHELASCVRRRTEVVCTVAIPREEEISTTGSDRSNYSGVYERDLEEILESIAEVSCHHIHPRRRNTTAFRSSHQGADKFYFRFPRTPETQSYWSSSDSCYGRSDSESESERTWTSEEELNLDEDPSAVVDSGSFFRCLNRFLLSGSQGPDMAVIEP